MNNTNVSQQWSLAAMRIPLTFIFCLSLFLYWNLRIMGYGENFLGSDSFLVVNKIFHSHELEWFAQTYLSQFGLPSIILAKLHNQPFNFSVISISLSAATLFSLITAATLSIPVRKINNIAGFPGVVCYWIALACSPWILPFSYSLYWVPFTIFIPAFITLYAGTLMHDARKWFVLTLVLIAMVIKCLCGYEYITTVTLFACAGYVFSLLRTGIKVRKSALALIFCTCVIGFLIALSIHVFQLHNINDNYGISTILSRAEAHTGTDGGNDDASLLIQRLAKRPGNEDLISILSTSANQHKILFFWTAFKEYFYLPGLALGGKKISFAWFVLISFIMSAICLSHFSKANKEEVSSDLKIFSFGVLLIFLGVFSWQILAWHHMTIHYHLNGQLFAYGIVPISMVGIGALINIAYSKIKSSIRDQVLVSLSFILCTSLIIVSIFNFHKSSSINDDFQVYEKSTSQVIASLDEVTITEGGSELYRGMEMEVNTVTVSGWAYAQGRDNARIFVFVKGGLVGAIKPTIVRNDVYQVHPEAGLVSGFNFTYNIPGKITRDDIRLLIPDGTGKYVELK